MRIPSSFSGIMFVCLTTISLFSCKEQANNSSHITLDQSDIVTETNWLSIEEFASMENAGSKKYFIDIYTEWCGWCKVMDKKTFSDPEVQSYLNAHFHLVKFDAESKNRIEYNGKSYNWLAAGRKGSNELAIKLLDGKLSYPALVYLDENKNKIRVSLGYKNPQELLQELEVITKS